MPSQKDHSLSSENSAQDQSAQNISEAASIDSATMNHPHNPDFENGRWFPTWQPYKGDLDRDPVGIN